MAPLLIWIRALLICLVSLCTLAEWPRTQTGTDTETHRINSVTPHETMLVISFQTDKIKQRERERKKKINGSILLARSARGKKTGGFQLEVNVNPAETLSFSGTNTAAVFCSSSSFTLLLLLIADSQLVLEQCQIIMHQCCL